MDESNPTITANCAVNNISSSSTPRHRHLTRSTTGSTSAGIVNTTTNICNAANSSTALTSTMANNSFNSTTSKRTSGTAVRRKRTGAANVQRKNLNVKVTSVKKNASTIKATTAIRKGPIRTSRLHINATRSTVTSVTGPIKHGPGRRRKIDTNAPSLDVKCQGNVSSKSSNFKIDIHAFLRHMMNENVRHEYIKQVDDHVNKLLDAVKCKEKGSGKRGKSSNQHRSQANQIAETKDKKIIDLSSPDSILSHISNPRILLNATSFASLPLFYQFKLVKMLPHCDQVITDQGWIKPSASSLTNEFFTKASLGWCENLKEGKFTSDYLQRKKLEMEREKSRLDPWKLKHFEPLWGLKLTSQGKLSSDEETPSKSLPPLDPVLCHIKTKAAAKCFNVANERETTVTATVTSSNSETEEEIIETNIVADETITQIDSVQSKSLVGKRVAKRRGKGCPGPLSKKLKKLIQDNNDTSSSPASVVPDTLNQIDDTTSHTPESKDESYVIEDTTEQSSNYAELTVTNSMACKVLSDGNLDAYSTATEADDVSFSDSKTKNDDDETSDISDSATVQSDDDFDETLDDDETTELPHDEDKCNMVNGKLYLPVNSMALDGTQIPRELQIIPVMGNGKSDNIPTVLNGSGVNVITLKSSKILPTQILSNILKKQSLSDFVTNRSESDELSTTISLPYKLPEGTTILPCTNKENDLNTVSNDCNGTPYQVPVITKSESSNSLHGGHLNSTTWSNNCPDQLHRLLPQITVIPLSSSPVDENESTDGSCGSGENSSDSRQESIYNQYQMNDDCACGKKALINCIKCGSWCHTDCIHSSGLCEICLMRNSYGPPIQTANASSVISECNSSFLYPV